MLRVMCLYYEKRPRILSKCYVGTIKWKAIVTIYIKTVV